MRQRVFCLSLKDIKLKSDGAPFFKTMCEGHICPTSSKKNRQYNDAQTALEVAKTTWQKAVKSIPFYGQHTFISLRVVMMLCYNY